jgi:hypothetical protein
MVLNINMFDRKSWFQCSYGIGPICQNTPVKFYLFRGSSIEEISYGEYGPYYSIISRCKDHESNAFISHGWKEITFDEVVVLDIMLS